MKTYCPNCKHSKWYNRFTAGLWCGQYVDYCSIVKENCTKYDGTIARNTVWSNVISSDTLTSNHVDRWK